MGLKAELRELYFLKKRIEKVIEQLHKLANIADKYQEEDRENTGSDISTFGCIIAAMIELDDQAMGCLDGLINNRT